MDIVEAGSEGPSAADDDSNPYLPSEFDDRNGNATYLTYDAHGNVRTIIAPLNDHYIKATYIYNDQPPANPLGWLTEADTQSLSADWSAIVGTLTPTKFEYYNGTEAGGKKGQLKVVHSPAPGTTVTLDPMTGQATGTWVDASFTYTALGNVATMTTPAPDNTGVLLVTAFIYDNDANFTAYPLQRLEAIGEPIAVSEPYELPNGNTHRLLHYRYDNQGNLAYEFSPLSDAANLKMGEMVRMERTDYIYNIANQLVSTVAPKTNQAGAGGGRAVTQVNYAYPGGPALEVSLYDEQNNNSYVWFYDAASPPQLGQLARRTQTTYGYEAEVLSVSGSTTPVSFDYDASYRLSHLKDGANHASHFEYDAIGNMFRHTWPGGKAVGTGYDTAGNLTSFTNARDYAAHPNTPTAQFGFSADHIALTSVTYPNAGPLNTNYAYDTWGRVITIEDSGSKLEYAYDDLGNPLWTKTTYKSAGPPNGPSAPSVPVTQGVSYEYFPDGNLAVKRYADMGNGGGPKPPRQGFINEHSRDTYGDGRALTCPAPPKTQQSDLLFPPDAARTLVDHYLHDPDGHRTHEDSGAHSTDNEVGDDCLTPSVTNEDTGNGDLLGTGGQVAAAFTNLLVSFSGIQYDAAGNLRGYYTDTPNGDINQPFIRHITTYVYDANTPNAMDRRDRLTEEQWRLSDPANANPLLYSNVFTPDAADNLTTIRTALNAFTFNSDNQIANNGFSYDDDGNLTARPGATLAYDAANRLTSYTYNGTTLNFGYRPDGLRAWKQVGNNYDSRTYFFYESGHLVYEMNKDTSGQWKISRYFRWTATGLAQEWNAAEGMVDYLFDPQGNAVLRHPDTTRSWEVVTRSYDAYGKLRWGAETNDPVGYNGKWGYYTDVPSDGTSSVGLILCTFRYYAPDLCRWLTRDPLGYEGGINVYAYCGDNPVGYADPSGLVRSSKAIIDDLIAVNKKIANISKKIQESIGELKENPGELPERAPGDVDHPRRSRWGHRRELNKYKKILADREAERAKLENELKEALNEEDKKRRGSQTNLLGSPNDPCGIASASPDSLNYGSSPFGPQIPYSPITLVSGKIL